MNKDQKTSLVRRIESKIYENFDVGRVYSFDDCEDEGWHINFAIDFRESIEIYLWRLNNERGDCQDEPESITDYSYCTINYYRRSDDQILKTKLYHGEIDYLNNEFAEFVTKLIVFRNRIG